LESAVLKYGRIVMQNKFVKLRVLAEFNNTYNVFVAHCLETGSVITASDEDMLKEMMKELLEDELSYALQHKSFANLFSSPAPFDVWKKWYEVANLRAPESIPLSVDTSEVFPGLLEVPSEAQMATAQ
jgi:hypothetical protein